MPVLLLVTCRTCGAAAPAQQVRPTFVSDGGFYVDVDVPMPVGWRSVVVDQDEDVECGACSGGGGGGA